MVNPANTKDTQQARLRKTWRPHLTITMRIQCDHTPKVRYNSEQDCSKIPNPNEDSCYDNLSTSRTMGTPANRKMTQPWRLRTAGSPHLLTPRNDPNEKKLSPSSIILQKSYTTPMQWRLLHWLHPSGISKPRIYLSGKHRKRPPPSSRLHHKLQP